MPDKQLGRPAAEDGTYGLSHAAADQLRAWAKGKAAEINADPSIPRRHRLDAERRADRLAGRKMRTVTDSVTKKPGRPKKDKTLSAAERSKAYRARKKD